MSYFKAKMHQIRFRLGLPESSQRERGRENGTGRNKGVGRSWLFWWGDALKSRPHGHL